ncbi:WecB/TagA/CpsF family glycosyltransferase [Gloeobacter kilaueensis]|uniref:Glycosyl transferase, WecB/TagA/CpsF family n=1 Tax=Gloeobacter kilaueensis (strain ATCC BAA-2537 / CCAP 1431/1 / ULC 316 / JS1) TaxID=1183438 RepID=U5QCP8_GLOK1|nr:WecB/TagA/CpsF family glycosyltransferase [Gloeobacter kilaueensis]AGY56697.1 glycosyl transferase, WecB/TagA/CpsF family [Gloeobacter kilaueensis JS1]
MDTLSRIRDLQLQLPQLEVHLLGRRITCLTIPSVIEALTSACVQDRQLAVAYYNVHSFNLSMQLPWFYEFLQSVDIALCDSMGMLGAMRYMGLALPTDYRVSYTLLMPQLLSACERLDFSVYLLGSRPVHLDRALEQVRAEYPRLRVAGHHGYFQMADPLQNAVVVEQINHFQPQVLVVGMGQPLQERWLAANRSKLLANVLMAGGAAIDRLAGVVPDCPPMLSNVGLEWLYRLLREPKRLSLRYLLGNPAFALQLALARSLASASETLEVKTTDLTVRP